MNLVFIPFIRKFYESLTNQHERTHWKRICIRKVILKVLESWRKLYEVHYFDAVCLHHLYANKLKLLW